MNIFVRDIICDNIEKQAKIALIEIIRSMHEKHRDLIRYYDDFLTGEEIHIRAGDNFDTHYFPLSLISYKNIEQFYYAALNGSTAEWQKAFKKIHYLEFAQR